LANVLIAVGIHHRALTLSLAVIASPLPMIFGSIRIYHSTFSIPGIIGPIAMIDLVFGLVALLALPYDPSFAVPLSVAPCAFVDAAVLSGGQSANAMEAYSVLGLLDLPNIDSFNSLVLIDILHSINVQVGDALMLVVIVVEWSVGFVLLSCLDEDIEVILGEFRILSRFCDQIVEHFENGRIGSYSLGLNGA